MFEIHFQIAIDTTHLLDSLLHQELSPNFWDLIAGLAVRTTVLAKDLIQFPASIWVLKKMCNCSSGRCDAHFWPPLTPTIHIVYMRVYIVKHSYHSAIKMNLLIILISDFSPPDFIVQFLEQQVCTLNWDVGFVIQTMNEIGVPLPRLLEVYDQLFKSRVRKTK